MRLIGIRPAEIRQHAIADEAGDIALLAGHRGSNARLIGREDFPQIFGIESAGQRRRAHDVTEQHGDLPPLGRGYRRMVSVGWRADRKRRGVSAECGDGIQQPTPMAHQDNAKFFEVFAGQIG
jgi:hypothetical protein